MDIGLAVFGIWRQRDELDHPKSVCWQQITPSEQCFQLWGQSHCRKRYKAADRLQDRDCLKAGEKGLFIFTPPSRQFGTIPNLFQSMRIFTHRMVNLHKGDFLTLTPPPLRPNFRL